MIEFSGSLKQQIIRNSDITYMEKRYVKDHVVYQMFKSEN
jgi:hypothetical protein